MERLLFIFGRHPTLSLAELTAVFPHMTVVARGSEWIVTTGIKKEEVDLRRIGGVVKWGVLGAELEYLDFTAMSNLLLTRHTTGKMTFGVSSYGARTGTTKTVLIGLKKDLKNAGVSSRFVNKNFENLTSAQSSLARLPEDGMELLIASNGKRFWVATTTAVQPFDSYKSRDYEKTVRDARIGMLPPKLAQMMINIAAGSMLNAENVEAVQNVQSERSNKRSDRTSAAIEQAQRSNIIYDPFCGTGTVLIEAGLLGYQVTGSDLNPKMVEASVTNLASMKITGEVFQHDAKLPIVDNATPGVPKITPTITSTTTNSALQPLGSNSTIIVTEGYLGPALSRVPAEHIRQKIFAELGDLYAQFFAWAPAPIVVITTPVYVENGAPKYFSSPFLTPIIEAKGWKKLNTTPLVYSRPDQIVGREILIWGK